MYALWVVLFRNALLLYAQLFLVWISYSRFLDMFNLHVDALLLATNIVRIKDYLTMYYLLRFSKLCHVLLACQIFRTETL